MKIVVNRCLSARGCVDIMRAHSKIQYIRLILYEDMKPKILLKFTPRPVYNPQAALAREQNIDFAIKAGESEKIDLRVIMHCKDKHAFDEILRIASTNAEVIVAQNPHLINDRNVLQMLNEYDVKILSELDYTLQSLEDGYQLIILNYDE